MNNNLKHTILLVLYVLMFVNINAQGKIKVVDCGIGYPIPNVLVIDSNGVVLTESNSLGEVELNHLELRQNLTFYKRGYKHLVLKSTKSGSTICLSIIGYKINEVMVTDSEINYIDILKSFIKKSQATMINEPKEVYYNFNYTVTLRKNQLEFKASGIIKINLLPYSKKYPALGKKITFCSLNLIIDSLMWVDEKIKKEVNVVIPLLKIWDDPIRKGGDILSTIRENKVFVRAKSGINNCFYIIDSLKNRTSIYFNADSTINSFYQYKIKNNNSKEDSIHYIGANQTYLSYRSYKSSKLTSLGIIDYQVKLKVVRNTRFTDNDCGLPYAIIFSPRELEEDYGFDIEIK